jgi:hypothetical protein
VTFVSLICQYFDMENIGKLRCFEDVWPQYGFTVLYKVIYTIHIYFSQNVLVGIFDIKAM